MTEWQPMETARKDGTPVMARIGSTIGKIYWCEGFLRTDETDCGAWVWWGETTPPECWTDGVCWDVNEDGVPSTLPTHWAPLSPPPEDAR